MKFIVSKKLSDNSSLRALLLWLLVSLVVAMGLNITAKGIDFGTSPIEWSNTVLGNSDEFIDPMGFSDLLLHIHSDLFGLIILYIMIASLFIRIPRSARYKIMGLAAGLITMILYPAMLIGGYWMGAIWVTTAVISYLLFHAFMTAMAIDLIVALLRRKI